MNLEVQKMVANPKKVNEMAQNLKQMRMAVPLVGCDWRVPWKYPSGICL